MQFSRAWSRQMIISAILNPQEPLFVEFADACLKVLHPEVADNGEGALTDEQVTAMLREKMED